MAEGGFWDNQERAQEVVQKVKALRGWVDPYDRLEARLRGARELDELLAGDPDAELAAELERLARLVYGRGRDIAERRGIIIADTKFEFGLDERGEVVLMDEVLTPDSSRYWPVEGYQAAFAAGENPPSYDKQFVRDWLEQVRIDGKPWGKKPPAPTLPQEVIEKTAAKYQEALQRLMG